MCIEVPTFLSSKQVVADWAVQIYDVFHGSLLPENPVVFDAFLSGEQTDIDVMKLMHDPIDGRLGVYKWSARP